MNLFTKLMLLAVVAAMAGPFVIKDEEGKPLLSWGDLKEMVSVPKPGLPAELKSLVSDSGETPDKNESEKPQPVIRTVYKWQDSDGVWHYGDEAPEGVAVNAITVNSETNIVPMGEAKQILAQREAEKKAAAKSAASPEKETESHVGPTTIPISQMPEAIQKAKDVNKLMEQRTEQLNQHL